MSTITTAKTITCGFCDTGAHEHCPGGVRNGDGKIVLCVCPSEGCNARRKRCTECNNREPLEIGPDWKCINRDDCQAEQQRRIDSNPFVQQMARVRAAREAQEALAGAKTAPKPTRGSEGPSPAPKTLPRPSVAGTRGCLCLCGGTTKGGKFLPGHDSKYLNSLVANPGADSYTLAYAVSEAFGKKYEKRIN